MSDDWKSYKNCIYRKPNIDRATGKADRKNKWRYKVMIRVQGYPTAVEYFLKLDDAETFAADTRSKMKAGKWLTDRRANLLTLNEAFDEYLKKVSKPKGAQRYKRDERSAKQLRPFLGKLNFNTLTVARVRDYRDKRLNMIVPNKGTRVKWRTVEIEKAFLSSVIKWVRSERDVKCENVARDVKKPEDLNPEQEQRKPIAIKDRHAKKLLSACKAYNSKFLYPMVVVAYHTGMRKSEIMELTSNRYDPKRRAIFLPRRHANKNAKDRWVYLTQPVIDAVNEALTIRPDPDDTDLIFWGGGRDKDGNRCPYDYETAWQTVRDKTGLTQYRFHDWRHTATTRLSELGVDVEHRMDQIGHKTRSMQDHYDHHGPKAMFAALSYLEKTGKL